MTALLFLAFALLEAADQVTHDVRRELNPIALGAQPWQALVLKAALVLFVAAVVVIARRKHAWLGPVILGVGVVAGAYGTYTNLVSVAR